MPGRGISDQFVRVGNDLLTVTGHARIAALIRQAVMTKRGEVPWRPELGSRLHRIVHRNLDERTLELARNLVIEALTDLPDVSRLEVEATRAAQSKAILITVRYVYTVDGSSGVATESLAMAS